MGHTRHRSMGGFAEIQPKADWARLSPISYHRMTSMWSSSPYMWSSYPYVGSL